MQSVQQLASSQQAAGSLGPSGSQPSKRSTSSVSSSSEGSSSKAPAEASSQVPGDAGDRDSAYGLYSVFQLSSPEEQYKLTLAALHSGRSTNLDQLAYMFEPQALLAGTAGALLALMLVVYLQLPHNTGTLFPQPCPGTIKQPAVLLLFLLQLLTKAELCWRR